MSTVHIYSMSRNRQQGMSLLVVLILLIVMSVLGVAVLRSSALQERMSANLRDRSLATQAVEAALAQAQNALGANNAATWIEAKIDAGDYKSLGVFPRFSAQPAKAAWITGPTLSGIPTQYWIEYLGENQASITTGGNVPAQETTSKGPLFRITAFSGSEGRAQVVLQTDVLYRIPEL